IQRGGLGRLLQTKPDKQANQHDRAQVGNERRNIAKLLVKPKGKQRAAQDHIQPKDDGNYAQATLAQPGQPSARGKEQFGEQDGNGNAPDGVIAGEFYRPDPVDSQRPTIDGQVFQAMMIFVEEALNLQALFNDSIGRAQQRNPRPAQAAPLYQL